MPDPKFPTRADVRAPFTNFTFKPTVHLNYEETVLRIRDGLSKKRASAR